MTATVRARPHGEAIVKTPDGRYLVVRGRLWRAANPMLTAERRVELVQQLMDARRSLRRTSETGRHPEARAQVDAAKRGLGERGPVWWTDGEPDYSRKLIKNTPYASWYARLLDRTSTGEAHER